MPRAGGSIAARIKYHYQDHDTDEVSEIPPIQNTWYEVFDAEDVRLLICTVLQTNDEVANADIEIRWTIDGTPYLAAAAFASGTTAFIYRGPAPSTGGTLGLIFEIAGMKGWDSVDKRGHSFKVEVRITSVPGTNQTLTCRCVRETLEET